MTTCFRAPALTLDLTSCPPNEAVPSRAIYSWRPEAAKRIRDWYRQRVYNYIEYLYSLSADSSSWSSLVSFKISSINELGLTRVSSTRSETRGPSSSAFFFRFSPLFFVRSRDPVSLITNEPELGFLLCEQRGNERELVRMDSSNTFSS